MLIRVPAIAFCRAGPAPESFWGTNGRGGVLKAFFENFAPPFPEKELRVGRQKKPKNNY